MTGKRVQVMEEMGYLIGTDFHGPTLSTNPLSHIGLTQKPLRYPFALLMQFLWAVQASFG
jgi:hypothetical protein